MADESRDPNEDEDRTARYDRMAWVLFTLPILVVILIVAARSCGGGEG